MAVAVSTFLKAKPSYKLENFANTKFGKITNEIFEQTIKLHNDGLYDIDGHENELKSQLSLLQTLKDVSIKKPKVPVKQNRTVFTQAFFEYLANGDLTTLVKDGPLMSEALFNRTKDYIFVRINNILGNTIHGYFIANPKMKYSSFMHPDADAPKVGNAVILRLKNQVHDIINFEGETPDRYLLLAENYNRLAAKSRTALNLRGKN